MDELSVYVNVERPAGHSSKSERETQGSENIYENMFLNTLEPNKTGPTFSDVEGVKKSSCRAAAVVLGLLGLVLLAGVITLFFLFTKSNSEWKMEMALLRNNLTKENEQLKASYNNLTRENEQLKGNNNNLTRENDQLKGNNNHLTRENDQLKGNNNNLTRENDQLKGNNNHLTRENEQLKANNNNLTREKDQLKANNNNLLTEKNKLQEKLEALTKEKNLDCQQMPEKH